MKWQLYSIHKWCGLIAGIFILLLGLSGALLVFHNEIDSLEHRAVWQIKNQAPVSIDKAYRIIQLRFPDYETRLTRYSATPGQALVFSIRKKGESRIVISHPSNGSILKQQDKNTTWSTWLLDLHYSLQGGSFGKLAIFVFGLIFFTSLTTGIFIYRKNILKVLIFKAPFKWRPKKAFSSSLHRYVAVWALLLNLLLVVTGLLISFDNLSHHGTINTASSQPVKVSLDSIIRVVTSRYPNFTPTYIRFPKRGGQPLMINGKVKGAAFYWTQYYNEITVDLVTGKINPLKLTSEGSLKTKIASFVGVIHLVEFDSFLMKLLFSFAGLSAPTLTITGFILWKSKKRAVSSTTG
ncbi:PepSY-associated TM helix domain-containing protein [Arcticibacter eurypsychrophilus]|uniref:PepSY-associated TM helix domain-containing protein n=1 Tax=Arcticibacter eurypsychrophilus TaxID=1434752 RepID=UPI00084CFA5A|nr:PepSY-associated TM helix domain-containing protein [Arcticibacter eurypsychrophilus]